MKRNNRKGFTTVELVIVIAVIAILATALIPTFSGLIGSAENTRDMQEARQLYNDVLAGELVSGTLPEDTTTWYVCVVKTGADNDIVFSVVNGKLGTKGLTAAEKTAVGTAAVVYTDADNGTVTYTKLTTGLPEDK